MEHNVVRVDIAGTEVTFNMDLHPDLQIAVVK